LINIISSQLIHKITILQLLLSCWFLQGQYVIVKSEIIENYSTNSPFRLKKGKPSKIMVLDTLYRDDRKDVTQTTYSFKDAKHFSVKKFVNNKLRGYQTKEIDSIGREISYTDSLLTGSSYSNGASKTDMNRAKFTYRDNVKIEERLDSSGVSVLRFTTYYDSLKNPTTITKTLIGANMTHIQTIDYNYEKGTFVHVDYSNGSKEGQQNKGFINLDYVIDKNEQGDITKMFWILSKKEESVIYNIDYTYDERGNWIRIFTTMNNPNEPKKVVSKTYRKIEYM